MEANLLSKVEKLNSLNETQKPLWGKMTPQHMVEHLIVSFKMCNGTLKVECFSPVEKLPTLKRFLLSSRPLPKNFVNPIIGEDLLPLEYKSLEEAKEILKSEINNYYLYFENNPDANPVNPTFGELNKEEWEVFHGKHVTHHFSQFGIL